MKPWKHNYKSGYVVRKGKDLTAHFIQWVGIDENGIETKHDQYYTPWYLRKAFYKPVGYIGIVIFVISICIFLEFIITDPLIPGSGFPGYLLIVFASAVVGWLMVIPLDYPPDTYERYNED